MQDIILKISRILKQRKLTISVVESCTGGLIQKLITDIPGSSEYFLGGVVAYSNKLKEKLVGVHPETLRKYGAVGSETALELAQGIRKITGANIGVSTTGIAGPTGGTPKKPVGLIYIGLCTKTNCTVKRFVFKGKRNQIRESTALKSLELVVKLLSR